MKPLSDSVTAIRQSSSPPIVQVTRGLEITSPLLRAYLANSKARKFKPIPPAGGGDGVTVLGLSPPPTPGHQSSVNNLDVQVSKKQLESNLESPGGAYSRAVSFERDHEYSESLRPIHSQQSMFRRGALKLPPVIGDGNRHSRGELETRQLAKYVGGGDGQELQAMPCFDMPLDFSGLIARRQLTAMNHAATDLSPTAKQDLNN